MPPPAPRDAGAPEPSSPGARLTLERAEVRRVSDVRRDGEHVGIALAQDLGVEEPAVGQPEIGEQPAVAIPPLDVELELDRLVAETAGGELGRPAAHRLDRRLRPVAPPRVAVELRRVVHLGRVDADQANAFDPRAPRPAPPPPCRPGRG